LDAPADQIKDILERTLSLIGVKYNYKGVVLLGLKKKNPLPGLKPWVSGIRRNNLRFAPGGHSSPGLKAWSFLADFIILRID